MCRSTSNSRALIALLMCVLKLGGRGEVWPRQTGCLTLANNSPAPAAALRSPRLPPSVLPQYLRFFLSGSFCSLTKWTQLRLSQRTRSPTCDGPLCPWLRDPLQQLQREQWVPVTHKKQKHSCTVNDLIFCFCLDGDCTPSKQSRILHTEVISRKKNTPTKKHTQTHTVIKFNCKHGPVHTASLTHTFTITLPLLQLSRWPRSSDTKPNFQLYFFIYP